MILHTKVWRAAGKGVRIAKMDLAKSIKMNVVTSGGKGIPVAVDHGNVQQPRT